MQTMTHGQVQPLPIFVQPRISECFTFLNVYILKGYRNAYMVSSTLLFGPVQKKSHQPLFYYTLLSFTVIYMFRYYIHRPRGTKVMALQNDVAICLSLLPLN